MQQIITFLKEKNMKLLPYQKAVIDAFQEPTNGLIEAPTGRGKTMAVTFGIISSALQKKKIPKILWVTPMRALARDTEIQLNSIFTYFFPHYTILQRISDSSQSEKKKARNSTWDLLITTPESCALLSTYKDVFESYRDIDYVIIDEWHILMNQKRGILFELFLSWLTSINPNIMRWGLSATIASSQLAADILSPNTPVKLIKDSYEKKINGSILLPESNQKQFDSLGIKLINSVIKKIKTVSSAIIFTNTRSQSEQWFKLLQESKQFKKNEIAIHHSAISNIDRKKAESGIKHGSIKCIIATSSLDLGVDLEPVDIVFHVGSPKGMARLKQRAGRSGHSPFATSEIILIPRNGFEIIESMAAINNLSTKQYEEEMYTTIPIDILIQHIINICMSASYSISSLYTLCKATHAFKHLKKEQLQWCLDFCCNEHSLLKAYPEYTKLIKKESKFHTNTSKKIQMTQRFNVGAITSENFFIIKYTNQRTLGTIEEQFIRQLNPTDSFLFAGQNLSIKRIQDDIVFVKKSNDKQPKYTRWFGGSMPYSSHLAKYLLQELSYYKQYKKSVFPIAEQFLHWQDNESAIPAENQCLIEYVNIDQCSTIFLYPFCGRAANQALAMGITYFLSQKFCCHTAMTVNDYGIMIQCNTNIPVATIPFKTLLTTHSISELSTHSFNQNEMILQEFRHICFVSGLLSKGLPGRLKTNRYTQSSVRILYDIFKEYDPTNLLLQQAKETVYNNQLFPKQLSNRLDNISEQLIIKSLKKISPFGYTLYNEQLSAKMNCNEN